MIKQFSVLWSSGVQRCAPLQFHWTQATCTGGLCCFSNCGMNGRKSKTVQVWEDDVLAHVMCMSPSYMCITPSFSHSDTLVSGHFLVCFNSKVRVSFWKHPHPSGFSNMLIFTTSSFSHYAFWIVSLTNCLHAPSCLAATASSARVFWAGELFLTTSSGVHFESSRFHDTVLDICSLVLVFELFSSRGVCSIPCL